MKLRDEGGIAMISAILVSSVALTLALIATEISSYTLSGARSDRTRVLTFHAAEAGVDHALQLVQTRASSSLPCAAPLAGTLSSSPGTGSYSVSFKYYPSYPPSGSPMACPLTASPNAVVISSLGNNSDAIGRPRRVEVAAQLTPGFGGFSKAIFSDRSIDSDNSLTVTGDGAYNADIYTNGDYRCDNSQQTNGNVYAQGLITLANSCNVQVDVWAKDAVRLENSITVGRDALSSESSITLLNSATIGRNVIAGTTISVGNSASIGGTLIENNVQPPPPAETFPLIPYDQASWVAAGFTVKSYTDCEVARNDLLTKAQTWTTKTVVRVTGCALAFAKSDTVNVKNDLAIIVDGGMTAANSATFSSVDGVGHKLYIIVPAGSTCTGTSPADITLKNSTTFATPLETFLYTPCLVEVGNSGTMLGQIYGGEVQIRNSVTLAFRAVGDVPGAGGSPGSGISIVYKREVPATTP